MSKNVVNALIEIPLGSRNKYELNKYELFLRKSDFLNTLREQFESDGKRKKKQGIMSL